MLMGGICPHPSTEMMKETGNQGTEWTKLNYVPSVCLSVSASESVPMLGHAQWVIASYSYFISGTSIRLLK